MGGAPPALTRTALATSQWHTGAGGWRGLLLLPLLLLVVLRVVVPVLYEVIT